MNLVLLKNYNHYFIVNDDANFVVGSVHPLNGRLGPYKVRLHERQMDTPAEAGVVNSLNEAIPALLAHYERVQGWDDDDRSCSKSSIYSSLRVEQNRQGSWVASRFGFPLLEHGKPASFASCEEAKRCAEAHELDLYPGAKEVADGFSWLPDPEIDWRSIPYEVEQRAEFERCASGWLP